MRVAYFDCFSGISGDMTLGALIDLGVSPERIEAGVRSMGLPELRVSTEVVKKCGFRAIAVRIDHPPEHSHRHLHHIEEMIDRATEVTDAAKAHAKRIFSLIAEAEAKMHHTTIRKVHFHEVGAIDSIADVVGVAIGLDALGIERMESSAVPTGTGQVKIEHGMVSIPAPATAELLRGVPLAHCEIPRELTTPTGAAILRAGVVRFGGVPSMRLAAAGYGAGTYDLPGQANVLRILLGDVEEQGTPCLPLEMDRVVVMETNIDDSTPEDLADVAQRLMAAGALDVFQIPCVMKKGRSGVLLSVVCAPASVEAMQHLLLTRTSTIGVRCQHLDRVKLIRRTQVLETAYGPLQVKLVQLDGQRERMSVEFDDARDLAEKLNVPLADVRQAAADAWKDLPAS